MTALREWMKQKNNKPWHHLCYCRRDLIFVKIFYFSFLGALGVVLPFAAVFLKQLGLSAFQIGIISGIRPVIGFISGPLWGSVADRFRIRRFLVIVSVLSWLGFFVGLYFIPAPPRISSCPDKLLHHGSASDGMDVNVTQSFITPNGSIVEESAMNITAVQRDRKLLREHLSWLYEPQALSRIFAICLLVICGGEFFQAPTTALQDAITLEVLGREELHQYGAQRAWGTVGWAACSLLAGVALNSVRVTETICGVDLVFADYRVVSYTFIAVMVIAIISVLKLDFNPKSMLDAKQRKEDASSSTRPTTCDIFKLFLNVHYGSWIMTTLFVGVSNGIIWGFLYWHLDNLGGSQLLMGIDSVVGCIFEFVAFLFVEYAIKYLGHMGIMYVGLIGYIIRFCVYASLSNPWFVLPADALQGVTFAFIWASLTSYSAQAIPSASLSTIQGIIHGVYFGLGNGLGHFLGGIIIGRFGAVLTFYSFAIACSLWLVFFALCQKFSSKPTNQFDYHDMADDQVDNKKTPAD